MKRNNTKNCKNVKIESSFKAERQALRIIINKKKYSATFERNILALNVFKKILRV